MKKVLFFLIVIFFISCQKQKPQKIKLQIPQDTLKVYAVKNYKDTDFWENISKIYSENYNTKIIYRFFQDTSALADSMIGADVVMGIDKMNYALLKRDTLFAEYRPINYQYIKRSFRPTGKSYLLPYSYNYNVFFYSSKIKDYPKTMGVLQDHDFAKKIVLFNPENTFLGRDFILQSLAIYNNLGCRRFWRGIKKNIFNLESDLKNAASRFKSEELFLIYFPLINPYILDEAYFLPQEGYFCSVFYMGIPAKAKFKEKSQRFIDFMLFKDAQYQIFYDKIGIPVSTEVLEDVADEIKLKKSGKNLCNKPSERVIRSNIRYMNAIWKRTFKKFKKKRK